MMRCKKTASDTNENKKRPAALFGENTEDIYKIFHFKSAFEIWKGYQNFF